MAALDCDPTIRERETTNTHGQLNGGLTSRVASPKSSSGPSWCSQSDNPSHFPGPTRRDTALRNIAVFSFLVFFVLYSLLFSILLKISFWRSTGELAGEFGGKERRSARASGLPPNSSILIIERT